MIAVLDLVGGSEVFERWPKVLPQKGASVNSPGYMNPKDLQSYLWAQHLEEFAGLHIQADAAGIEVLRELSVSRTLQRTLAVFGEYELEQEGDLRRILAQSHCLTMLAGRFEAVKRSACQKCEACRKRSAETPIPI